jgi:ribosomal protein S18 acetylase RimI-like enzyme
MIQPSIRPVQSCDASALAPLMQQLGYTTSAAVMVERIACFADRADDLALVAEFDGVVVGCIGLHVLDLFHAPVRLGRITALVVDERCRGQGVGAALVAAGEAWLAARGCGRIELTSNISRVDAHRFYQGLGYANESLRFVKYLLGSEQSAASSVAALPTQE